MTDPTEAQWNRLLDAVSVDRELQGEFMGPGAAGRMTAKWEQLAAILNQMGGAFKTGDKWKEAYCNLRNRAKRQYADRSRYMRATGGGPPPPASLGLSPVYQRVLAHLPLQHIIGLPQVPAPLQAQQQQAGFVPQNPVQQAVLPQNPVQQAGFVPQNPVQQAVLPQNPVQQAGFVPQNPVQQAVLPQNQAQQQPQHQVVQHFVIDHLDQPSSSSVGPFMDSAGAPPPTVESSSVFRGYGQGHNSNAINQTIGTGDLIEAIHVLTATISSLSMTVDTTSLDAAIQKFAESIETLSRLQ